MGRLFRPLRPEPGDWRPVWLGKPVLCAFIILYLVFAAFLILIHYLDLDCKGFSLSLTRNHWVWRYSPTVVLVIVVSLWRRVNYCVLVNQPWYELSNGPQSADKTVLLDYLWPLQITSFFLALRRRHFAVAGSISIFVLLKIVIVISTTLFVPRDSYMSSHVNTITETQFESVEFWKHANTSHLTGGELRTDMYGTTVGMANISGDAVWSYSNLQEKHPDRQYPIDASTAFAGFSIASMIPGNPVKVSAAIDVAEVRATCEIPSIQIERDSGIWRGFSFNPILRTPSCDFGNIRELEACPAAETSGPISPTMCSHSRLFRVVEGLHCTGRDPKSGNSRDATTHYAIVAAQTTPMRPYANETGPGFANMAVVTCSLSYSINRGIAHRPNLNSSHIASLDVLGPHGHISNYTNENLMETVVASLVSAQGGFKNGDVASSYTGSKSLLGLMSGSATSTNLDHFYNSSYLKNTAENVLEGMGQQVMRRYFLAPSDAAPRLGSGSVDYVESRLHTRKAALWAMVSLFCLCACLVSVVIAYTQLGVAPQSPAKLNTNAVVLSRSPEIMSLLQNWRAHTRLEDGLRRYEFRTTKSCTGGLLAIEVTESRQQSPVPRAPNPDSQSLAPFTGEKWGWMPYASRRHATVLTLLLPVLIIMVLEILWQFSSDYKFVTLSSDSSVASYVIRYASTGTLLLIATLFSTLEFSVATITPFRALAVAAESASRTILFSLVEDLVPLALYKAVRRKHYAAVLSLVASTTGSFLTIVVSGLWVFKTSIQVPSGATADLQSGWALNFTAESPDTSLGAKMLTDIANGVITESANIRDNMVFPIVGRATATDIPTPMRPNRTEVDEFNVILHPLQPYLDCSVLPSDATKYTEETDSIPVLTTLAELPAGCKHAAQGYPADLTTFQYVFNPDGTGATIYEVPAKPNQLLGRLTDLNVTSASRDNSSICPSLGLTFGYRDLATQTHTITSLLCTQRLRSIAVNATYSNTNSSSSEAATLVSHSLITSSSSPSPAFPSSLSYAIDHMFKTSVAYEGVFSEKGDIDDIPPFRIFGKFLSYLLDSTDGGIPMTNVIQPHSNESLLADPELLISAADELYRQLMLHVLDLDLRATIQEKVVLNGTTNLTISRLKISEPSKLTLQILLGFMALLGAATYRLIDMRGVIPRNPYHIANSMALFQGSRIAFGEGGISWEEKDKDERCLRLGWWACNGAGDGAREQAGGNEQEDGDQDVHDATNDDGNCDGRAGGEGDEEIPGRRPQALVYGRRFGIDFLEDGICSEGWITVEKRSAAPGSRR